MAGAPGLEMSPAQALRRRGRRAARRRRRVKVQWHEKDGRFWLTSKIWPRGHTEWRVFTVFEAA